LPLIVRLPLLSIVKALIPPEVTVKAFPEAVLVRASPVALPLLVRLKEVGVPRPDAKTKSIFLPLVVVMVLPPTYADCKVIVLAEHLVTLFDETNLFVITPVFVI